MEKKKISLKEIGLPKLALIFIVGVMLIILSFADIFASSKNKGKEIAEEKEITSEKGTNMTSHSENTYIEEMENKFESILRKVSGVGEVKVMLRLRASSEQVTLKDNPYTQEGLNEEDGEGGRRSNNKVQREDSSVLVSDKDGRTVPYIIQEIEPEIEGVVVIAEGGDNPQITSDIMEAAEVLFGVPAHKVKVMKMDDGIN